MRNSQNEIKSYTQAAAWIAAGRNPRMRKAPIGGGNTRFEYRDDNGAIECIQHYTAIVTYYPSGKIVLDNGGWFSPTTKDKLSLYSPVSISQSDGVWYVSVRNPKYVDGLPYVPGTMADGKWIPAPTVNDGVPYRLPVGGFRAGMSIYNGRVSGQVRPEEIAETLAAARAKRKEILSFTKMITVDSVPEMIEASAGDCFTCGFGYGGGISCAGLHLEERYMHWGLVKVHGDHYSAYSAARAVEADQPVSPNTIKELRKSVGKSLRAILLPEFATR